MCVVVFLITLDKFFGGPDFSGGCSVCLGWWYGRVEEGMVASGNGVNVVAFRTSRGGNSVLRTLTLRRILRSHFRRRARLVSFSGHKRHGVCTPVPGPGG